MSKIKLSEKELQMLKDLQTEGNELIFSLGQLEAQKVPLYSSVKEVQEKQDKLGKELQEKYGDGNIDLETGEFTKPE
jgi:hypothetical protein|tara:strand:+ start:3388 stop:3618 length:231 start_codon:yes stop_codon:yes gene_type:complete